MGLTMSRYYHLDFWHLIPRRSQQDETMHGYSINKNYFCNHFFMGGECFEVNDPDYLFGDNCDLNFLTCLKPNALPYSKAQQSLLANVGMKQKAINKVSSRINRLSSPLNMLTGRHRQVSQSNKQDAQTQTLNNLKGTSTGAGPEPSQPLVMLINIRKETLRLIKSPHANNIDDESDQNSLANAASVSDERKTIGICSSTIANDQSKITQRPHRLPPSDTRSGAPSTSNTSNRHSLNTNTSMPEDEIIVLNETAYYSKIHRQSDSSSITSNTLSSAHSTTTSKSGYRSVKDVPPSECASDENDEHYQDALNEPTNQDDDESINGIRLKPLGSPRDRSKQQTSKQDNNDIRITIRSNYSQTTRPRCSMNLVENQEKTGPYINQPSDIYHEETSPTTKATPSKKTISSKTMTRSLPNKTAIVEDDQHVASTTTTTNRVYNIEFTFDAEVDCYIRIFYFCTREISSNSVSYRPQHATYKSKTYTYKRGLDQKFEQPEHTFQPYLFDEDLLIYKPLDLDGNYNSGAVFPIVIHCAAMDGPSPRQCQSLVATVEKSQLDDSYSIKPLKQLLFVDGVQYILQDIYGIENKPLAAPVCVNKPLHRRSSSRISRSTRNLRSSSGSLYSTSHLGSNMNLSDTASIASVHVVDGGPTDAQIINNQLNSLGSENTFECVICMSEERDTMLLPCRHLCLCSLCAQSLRYQASSCPICRCPFKAALNLRVIQRKQACHQIQTQGQQPRSWSTSTSALAAESTPTTVAAAATTATKSSTSSTKSKQDCLDTTTTPIVRRESVTSSATPLLASPAKDAGSRGSAPVAVAADQEESEESNSTCSRSARATQCPKAK